MIRKFFKLIILFVVIVLIAAWAAPYLISEDSYKHTLIEKIEAATGRKLTIDGHLRLKFLPTVGIYVEKATLSNPAGFGKEPMVSLDAMTVNVGLLPLLSGAIEINDLVLDEPVINLRVAKSGAQNWTFASHTAVPQSKPSPAGNGSIPGFTDLRLNTTIKNGTISYADDTSGQSLELKSINLKVQIVGSASPVVVKGSAQLNGQKVEVNATLTTLATLLTRQDTDIDAEIGAPSLSMKLKGDLNQDVYTGKVMTKTPSLTALATWLNPKSKPVSPAKLEFSIISDAKCTQQDCTFSDATISLDKLEAKGSMKASWAKAVPSINLDLSTNVLNLNDFLPPEQHADAGGGFISDAIAEISSHWSTAPLDLSALKSINADAKIQAAGLVYRAITIGNSTLLAKLSGGKLALDVPSAGLYNGTGTITVALDGSSTPAVTTHLVFKDIQMEKLLQDAASINQLTGTGNMELSTSCSGKSVADLVSSLSGSGKMSVSKGVIKGVNLGDMARNVQSAFKLGGGSQETAFTDLSGTFAITGGVISNKDLSMDATGMKLSGQGEVNLPAYTVNYRLTPQMVSGTGKTAKQGIGVPVLVTGSLDSPRFAPDVQSTIKKALQNPKEFKQELKNTRGMLKDQFINNPKEAIQNLKGLLGGGGLQQPAPQPAQPQPVPQPTQQPQGN